MEGTEKRKEDVREGTGQEPVSGSGVPELVPAVAVKSREELEAEESYRRALRDSMRKGNLERNGFDRAGFIDEQDAVHLGHRDEHSDDPNYVGPNEHYEVILPGGRI